MIIKPSKAEKVRTAAHASSTCPHTDLTVTVVLLYTVAESTGWFYHSYHPQKNSISIILQHSLKKNHFHCTFYFANIKLTKILLLFFQVSNLIESKEE